MKPNSFPLLLLSFFVLLLTFFGGCDPSEQGEDGSKGALTTDVRDQEMPNPVWNYWEGRVEVSGVKGSEAVQGMGFVELTGYAGRPIFGQPSSE